MAAEPAIKQGGPAPVSNWLTVKLARGFWSRFRMLAKRSGVRGYFALLALFSLIMSLGPLLHVAGRRFPVPLPYAAAYFLVPGFASLRVPGRWAVLVTLSLAILAGYGFDVLTRLKGRGKDGGAHHKASDSRRTRVLFAAALGLALLTSWSAPIPMVTFPAPDTMPAVYHWLARQPGDFAILDLPMPARESDESPLDGARQIYSLYHGKRRLDGLSGFVPPDYHVFRMVMQGFPRPGAIRAARERGARYIIFHYGDLPPDERVSMEAAAEAYPALDVAGRFGDDVVYEIVAR